MIQRHSIILWKKPEEKDKDFDEISKEAFQVLNILQNYPVNYRPNYLTGSDLSDVKEFPWDLEHFRERLKKGLNQEDDHKFYDLGYSISFFSSMNENDSCAIQMRTGIKNKKFYNTLIINLPVSTNVFGERDAEMIREMFQYLVLKYEPFWGCISNKKISRKYGKLWENDLPVAIHWGNYWSKETVESIGQEKIGGMIHENPQASFENGILFIKDTALDVNNHKDMDYCDKWQRRLLS